MKQLVVLKHPGNSSMKLWYSHVMSTCLQCMHDISMAGLLHPLNTSYVGEKSKPPLTCEQRIGYLVPKGMNHSYLLCSLTEKSWAYENDCIVTVTYSVHKHVCPKWHSCFLTMTRDLGLVELLKCVFCSKS